MFFSIGGKLMPKKVKVNIFVSCIDKGVFILFTLLKQIF